MSWFKRSESRPGSVTLSVYLGEGDAEFEAVVREFSHTDFRRVVISGGTFKDLTLLAPCAARLEVLLLQSAVSTSFHGIEQLQALVELNCDVPSQKPLPDYSGLHKLEKCFLAWDKKYDAKNYEHGLFALPRLKDLTLRSWSKPDCADIARLPRLERLDLRQGPLASLGGLENCAGLRALELAYLPKLADIASIGRLQGLEEVRIENCPSIQDFSPLTALPNLRRLHLDKVAARFADLAWLRAMPHLEKICLSREVLDIDWEILFNHPGLRSVALDSHEGYQLADADILKHAQGAARKVSNFKRLGTRKLPSFVFELA